MKKKKFNSARSGQPAVSFFHPLKKKKSFPFSLCPLLSLGGGGGGGRGTIRRTHATKKELQFQKRVPISLCSRNRMHARRQDQIARIHEKKGCDLHRGVQWGSGPHTPLSQVFHGMSKTECADKCLGTALCSAFELFVGNDVESGKCRLYAVQDSDADKNIKTDSSRDRIIGFCKHERSTVGSIEYETSRYEHASLCTLVRPVKFARTPSGLLHSYTDKDADSCATACIENSECTAFDVYTEKDVAAGHCNLYSMSMPAGAMRATGVIVSDPRRSHVVGLCTRKTKEVAAGYEPEHCPMRCQHPSTG